MSKFLALGMTLDDVVASVTSRAVAAIGKAAELGSLAPGMAGDAVVMDLEDGRFTYMDGAGNEVKATRRFRTRHASAPAADSPPLTPTACERSGR
jgi:dihydroorotase